MSTHAEALRERVRRLRPAPASLPWRRTGTPSVGGLLAVGFGQNSDSLLAISHDGRGVFDCRKGGRVARDRGKLMTDADYDAIALTAAGIGPLEGQVVRVGGLTGGALPRTTHDDWSIEIVSPDWPEFTVILQPPGCSFIPSIQAERCVRLETLGAGEFRTAGFSSTGLSLVVATSADIDIWSRA